MYLPGTSDGTESHINDTRGGHCNDTKRGIFMKIEVYVCKKNNLNDTGIFDTGNLYFGYVSRTFRPRAETII